MAGGPQAAVAGDDGGGDSSPGCAGVAGAYPAPETPSSVSGVKAPLAPATGGGVHPEGTGTVPFTPIPSPAPEAGWSAPTGVSPPPAPTFAPPAGSGPAPTVRRAWAAVIAATATLVLLGGVLPVFSGAPQKIIDSGQGVVYIAGICLLLTVLAVDVLVGSEVALAAAAGVGTMVMSIAGIVAAVSFEVRHLAHPSVGAVFLIVAALPAIALLGGAVTWLGRRHSRPVHPALAAAAAGGGAVSVVGLLIPPLPHESLHAYLLTGSAVINVALLLPVFLTAGCAVATAALRTAAAVALSVGSAAGLLAIWGANEIVRAQNGQGPVSFLNGEWVAVAIGLVVSLAAGVWALAATAPAPAGARGPLLHRSGVAPLLAAAAAVVIVPLAVGHHASSSSGSPLAYSTGGTSVSGGYDSSGSSTYGSPGGYTGAGGSYDTTPSTDYPPPQTTPDTSSPSTDYVPPNTNPPSTALDTQTAELQAWPYDPTRCGPQPQDQGQPWSASHTYQVTATIHLWSGPTTSSVPLDTIVVSDNGPGGAGCASGDDPTVTVICTVQGQTITGPFGSDDLWDQVSWKGQTGYLTDEWVDTKWDASSLPSC